MHVPVRAQVGHEAAPRCRRHALPQLRRQVADAGDDCAPVISGMRKLAGELAHFTAEVSEGETTLRRAQQLLEARWQLAGEEGGLRRRDQPAAREGVNPDPLPVGGQPRQHDIRHGQSGADNQHGFAAAKARWRLPRVRYIACRAPQPLMTGKRCRGGISGREDEFVGVHAASVGQVNMEARPAVGALDRNGRPDKPLQQ